MTSMPWMSPSIPVAGHSASRSAANGHGADAASSDDFFYLRYEVGGLDVPIECQPKWKALLKTCAIWYFVTSCVLEGEWGNRRREDDAYFNALPVGIGVLQDEDPKGRDSSLRRLVA